MNQVCPKCKHIMPEGKDNHKCPDAAYQKAKRTLINGALEAEANFSLDELEEYSRRKFPDQEEGGPIRLF